MRPLIDSVANVVIYGFTDIETKDIAKKVIACGCRVIALPIDKARLKMNVLITKYDDTKDSKSNVLKYALHKNISIITVVQSDIDIETIVEFLNPERGDIIKSNFTIEQLALALKRCIKISSLINQYDQKQKLLKKNTFELNRIFKTLQSDQKAAYSTQIALSPESPKRYDNVTFKHIMLPSNYLSGDFIHYSRTENNRVLFYLLDVSGHGAAAAFVTVMARQLIAGAIQNILVNRYGDDLENTPQSFMTYINREIYQSHIDKHLTIFIGNYHIETNVLKYIIGGHTPSPIITFDDKVEFLKGEGPPLGLFKDAKWEQQLVELPKQFKLLCFSDGIYELMDKQLSIADKNTKLLHKSSKPFRNLLAFMRRFQYNKSMDLVDDISLLTIEK